MGVHWPPPEEMLGQLLALAPATECHIDGSYPLGTDTCGMVVKDEHDRLLITHEAASENGEDARQCLQRCQALGLKVTAAFSDDSHRFTEAIKAVYPHARFQADHFHTVKNIWGHLNKSLLSYRRKVKASGAEKNDEPLMALAKPLWKVRWGLLKKPTNLSLEEKQTIAELEREDAGFVQRFNCVPCAARLRQQCAMFTDWTSSIFEESKLRPHEWLLVIGLWSVSHLLHIW